MNRAVARMERNQAIKLGNLGRVDYLLGLANIAGARRQ